MKPLTIKFRSDGDGESGQGRRGYGVFPKLSVARAGECARLGRDG